MESEVRKFLEEMCRKAADEGADAVDLDHYVDKLLSLVRGFRELFIFRYGYSPAVQDGSKHLDVARIPRPGDLERFWPEFGAMIRCSSFDKFFTSSFSTVLLISGEILDPPKA